MERKTFSLFFEHSVVTSSKRSRAAFKVRDEREPDDVPGQKSRTISPKSQEERQESIKPAIEQRRDVQRSWKRAGTVSR